MLDKGKISALQMAMLMNPTILATAILSAPALTTNLAERDMWISPFFASLLGFVAVYLSYRLNTLYPNESVIEYSGHIVGRAAGKILGFVFLIFYLNLDAVVIREYGEFVLGSFLTRTPMQVVLISMILVSAFAVYGGVEVLGRCAEIMVPVVMLLFIVIVLLLIPELEPDNVLPIMEKGIVPALKGALVQQGWFSEYFMISFILPFVTDRNKAMKFGMLSVASVVFLLLISHLSTLMLFGKITGSLSLPVLIAARYISYADFFEHVESVVMAIWVTGMFIKITVFYYVTALGTAQWLKLSDHKRVVLPIGFVLVVFSMWSATNSQELTHYLGTTIPFYLTTVQVFIPLILLLAALIRRKIQSAKGG